MKSLNHASVIPTARVSHQNEAVGNVRLPGITTLLLSCLCFGIFAASLFAQDQAPQPDEGVPASALVTKSVQAIGYEVGAGGTKVELIGTELMPEAKGDAKVEIKSKSGASSIEINVKGLKPPSTLGAEFLTYVAWVVTPEGRTGNTGELLVNKNGDGKLTATTPAQTFSVIVTAEPYSLVRMRLENWSSTPLPNWISTLTSAESTPGALPIRATTTFRSRRRQPSRLQPRVPQSPQPQQPRSN